MDFIEKMQITSVVEILQGYINDALEKLPTLIMALIVFLCFWALSKFCARLTQRFTHRFVDDPSIRSLLETTTKVFVIAFGIFVTAAMIFPGLKAGDLIGVLGLSSVAIGFAFKDIFQNFFAGILILTQRPFTIGDQIRQGDIEGTVQHINIRYTTIQAFDGVRLIVPNSELYTNTVAVKTALKHRRTTFEVGIAYTEDIELARGIIHAQLAKCEGVLEDPAAQVYVTAFGESSIDFDVRYWTKPQKAEEMATRDQVATAIKYAFDKAGIEIPYPYRSVEFVDKTDYAEIAKTLNGSGHALKSGPRIAKAEERDGDDSASSADTRTPTR